MNRTTRRALAGVAATAALVAAGLFGTADAAMAAPNAQDRAFLTAAHQSNLAEIASAQLAQQKATTQKVKDLAATWLTDHTKLDNDLKPVAQRLNVTLPDAPNAEQQAVAAKYRATSGAAFDKLWVQTQMDGHMKTMRAGESEIANGSDATVVTLARAAAPVVANHGKLLDAAAPTVGLAPMGVDSGNGISSDGPTPLAWGLIGGGVVVVAVSALVMWRRPKADATA